MISSEVQRTLVKSPPELWAEVSDPASLSRHLGELGEVRITRAEPERLVEWEAAAARGTVAIKASGWGTKVTLTASLEPNLPPEHLDAPVVAEPQPSGLDAWSLQEAEVAVTAAERFGHEHAATLLGTDLQRAADRELEARAGAGEDEPPEAEAAAPEPVAIAESALPEPAAPEPRRGFFARLFGRGREHHETRAETAPAEAAAETPRYEQLVREPPAELLAPEPEAHEPVLSLPPEPEAHEPVPSLPPEPEADEPVLSGPVPGEPAAGAREDPPASEVQGASGPDLSAELKAAEEAAEAEVTAILTGVLDRLGAAHHRPFSRS